MNFLRNTLRRQKKHLLFSLKKPKRVRYRFFCTKTPSKKTGTKTGFISTFSRLSRQMPFYPQLRHYFRIFFIRYPMIGGGVIGGFKAGAADYVTQSLIEQRVYKKSDINWKRTLLFGMLGITYGGFINYFLHSYLNPLLWGGRQNPMTVIKSILFDQLVHTPFVSFPIFYGFKGLVYSNFDINESKRYITHYWQETIYEDLLMCWRLWVPAHIITYGFVPRKMRVYWVNCVSATWTGILSYSRGEVSNSEEDHVQNNEKNQEIESRNDTEDINTNTKENTNRNENKDNS